MAGVTYRREAPSCKPVHRPFILSVDDERMKKLLVLLIVVFATSTVFAAEKPKISMKKAKAIALKKVPGGKIESAELENEGGKLIYSFDIKARSGITEVNVDAMNGKIVAVQNESPAKEAAEKKAEQKKKP
jgi:Peptidase propeptide and YPEB domain